MLLTTPEFRDRLKRLRLAAERLSSSRKRGARTSRAVGSGLEFTGHRAYSPGDDTRYLDWNALGRLDQLVLKQFEAPGELTVVIANDCATTMRFGDPDKFNHAAEVAAAIAYLSLHTGDRVVVSPFPGAPDLKSRNFSGSGNEIAMLASIARLRPRDDPAHVTPWLAAIRALQGDLLVVLLTDFLNRKPLLEALRELGRMRARCLVVHSVAPQEAHPEMSGRTRIGLLGAGSGTGGRSTVTLDVTPAVLEEYRREFDNFRQAVAAACRRVRAGMVDAYSAWPMEDVVLSLVSAGVLRVKRG